MYSVSSSRRPLPAIGPTGEQRGPWMAEIEKGGVVKGVTEFRSSSQPSSSRAVRRRKPVAGAPWESLAVQTFGRKVMDPEAGPNAPIAMTLQHPQGTVLQAVGHADDHKVAGQAVSAILKGKPSSAVDPTPPRRQSESRGGASAASSSLVCAGGSTQVARRDRVAFGAVYEHRDSSGKARLIGSTGVVPERQWQLDWQDNRAVRDLALHPDSAPGSNAHLVWVGVGSGPVGEDEMQRVRQAVVEARSERLQIAKLGSEKPYSHHF